MTDESSNYHIVITPEGRLRLSDSLPCRRQLDYITPHRKKHYHETYISKDPKTHRFTLIADPIPNVEMHTFPMVQRHYRDTSIRDYYVNPTDTASNVPLKDEKDAIIID